MKKKNKKITSLIWIIAFLLPVSLVKATSFNNYGLGEIGTAHYAVEDFDVTVSIQLNESSVGWGWQGSYKVEYQYYDPVGLDYLCLSSSSFLIYSNAEVSIPIDYKNGPRNGTFILNNNEKEPNGLNFLGAPGPSDPQNPNYISSLGSLNLRINGSNNSPRIYKIYIIFYDNRPISYPHCPYYRAEVGFIGLDDVLILSP